MNDDGADSQLMNYLVRMVVPMRREFGRQLNVGQFLHDVTYAREVLDEALRSKDARLLEYARYVEMRLNGPRIAAAAAAPVVAPAVADKPEAVERAERAERPTPAAGAAASNAEEMRARIMKKYTDGLR
jgi:hypothetical protein